MKEKIIKIKAKPNSKFNKVVQIDENTFEIYIKSPPIENKANEAIIDLLADYFKTSKNNILFLTGKKSKNKLLKILLTLLALVLMFLLLFEIKVFSKTDTKEIYYFLSKGDIYQAEKLIYEVLKEDQFNPDALFAQAIIIITKTDNSSLDIKDKREYYQKSLEILLSLEKKMKGFYYYHYILGKNYERLNDIPNSLFNYDNSIKLNRKFTEAYISRANLYWKLNKYNEAIDSLKNINDITAYLALANFYYQLYNFDESFKNLEKIYTSLAFKRASKETLNEIYFLDMWIKYRYFSKTNKNKGDLEYLINQNKKYNSDKYYSDIANSISLILKKDKYSYEQALNILLKTISETPNKPYSYFLIYNILYNFNKNNAILFLKKAVEKDIYNLDFQKELNSNP
mgnify:CR=1 FL=1